MQSCASANSETAVEKIVAPQSLRTDPREMGYNLYNIFRHFYKWSNRSIKNKNWFYLKKTQLYDVLFRHS